jgi:aspartyl-tRNA(Asn)/glutamyl-tRNA(Gln) amidotransferase subunit A
VDPSGAGPFPREQEINAFVHVDHAALAAGPGVDGRLTGRAVAVKDNIAVRGAPWACGSATRRALPPSAGDAEVVRRVRAAGGVVVGTTNLDELAMGASTETSAWGPTRNPCDPARTAGGSSGGSAAAVAAYGVLALGTDTGGSIREPASWCGVVGVAPSHGTVPVDDVVDFAPTFDRVGPLAPTVAEAALLHEVIGERDGLVAAAEAGRSGRLENVTIGVVVPMSGHRNAPEVLERFEAARMTSVALGASVVPVSVPRFGDLLDVYVTLTSVEALPVLETHAALGPLGGEAASRLQLGRMLVGSQEHAEALEVREQIRADLADAFAGCDVLLSPTVPLTAPLIGRAGMADPLARPRTDWWTVEANLASVPAISVPAGLGKGLPVGVQLMAPDGADDRLYRVGAALESASGPPR